MSIALILQILTLALNYGPAVLALLHEIFTLLHHRVPAEEQQTYLDEVQKLFGADDRSTLRKGLMRILSRLHDRTDPTPPAKAA